MTTNNKDKSKTVLIKWSFLESTHFSQTSVWSDLKISLCVDKRPYRIKKKKKETKNFRDGSFKDKQHATLSAQLSPGLRPWQVHLIKPAISC